MRMRCFVFAVAPIAACSEPAAPVVTCYRQGDVLAVVHVLNVDPAQNRTIVIRADSTYCVGG